jgi:hypothetical protein
MSGVGTSVSISPLTPLLFLLFELFASRGSKHIQLPRVFDNKKMISLNYSNRFPDGVLPQLEMEEAFVR